LKAIYRKGCKIGGKLDKSLIGNRI